MATVTTSLFGSTAPPVAETANTTPYALGMRFRAACPGRVVGVRYYKTAGNRDPDGTACHTGHLYDNQFNRLATVTFPNDQTADVGWREARFETPVTIAEGDTYIIAYWHPGCPFVAEANGWATGRAAGPLHGVAYDDPAGKIYINGPEDSNGVYYPQLDDCPTQTFHPSPDYKGTNYWVDVLFEHDPADLGVPPTTATLTGPAFGAVGQPATFTLTLDRSAETAYTFTPSDGGAGGTFSPANPAITPGIMHRTATFTYTPGSAGAKAIDFTVTPTLTRAGRPLAFAAHDSVLRSTTRDGDWDDPATWTGGVVPGPVDKVAIGHAVTVPADVTATCGDGTVPADPDTATGAAIYVAGGTLTIAGTLTWSGQFNLGPDGGSITSRLTVGPGGKLLARANAGVRPVFTLSTGGSGHTIFECLGTASQRATFGLDPDYQALDTRLARAKVGLAGDNQGLPGYASRGRLDGGTFAGSHAYADFSGFGDTGLVGLKLFGNGTTDTIDHCTFDRCQTELAGYVACTDSRWTNSCVVAPVGQWYAIACHSGTHFTRCSFDERIYLDASHGSFDTCYLGNAEWLYASNDINLKAHNWPIKDSVYRNDSMRLPHAGDFWTKVPAGTNDTTGVSGKFENNYFCMDSVGMNPHGITPVLGKTPDGKDWINGDVIGNVIDHVRNELLLDNDNGDIVQFCNLPNGMQVAYNVYLPIYQGPNAGNAAGTAVSLLGGGAWVAFHHNTGVWTSTSPQTLEGYACRYGESDPGNVDNFTLYADNLMVNLGPGRSGYFLCGAGGGHNPGFNYINPAVCHHNAGYHLINARDPAHDFYRAEGYAFPGDNGTPGANDVLNEAPGFVDPTRRANTWAQTFYGTDGSYEQAWPILAADPTLIPGMIAWVKAGYLPTNPLLRAASDGTWIGAIQETAAVYGTPEIASGVVPAPAHFPPDSGIPCPEFTAVSPGYSPDLGGYVPFRDANGVPRGPIGELCRDISQDPVDPDSDAIIAYVARTDSVVRIEGAEGSSAGWVADYRHGISFNIVDASTPLVKVVFDQKDREGQVDESRALPDNSDPGLYRIPVDAALQGSWRGNTSYNHTDGHIETLDVSDGKIYCLYGGWYDADNQLFHAVAGAIYDSVGGGGGCRDAGPLYLTLDDAKNDTPTTNSLMVVTPGQLRPDSLGGSDASGLPLFPFCIKYQDVKRAQLVGPDEPLPHAIRATFSNDLWNSQGRPILWGCHWLWPATHTGLFGYGANDGKHLLYGDRLRMKRSYYDLHKDEWDADTRTIASTLVKRGCYCSDGGTGFALTACVDGRWDYDNGVGLHLDGKVPATAFEVVERKYTCTIAAEPSTIAYHPDTGKYDPVTVTITRANLPGRNVKGTGWGLSVDGTNWLAYVGEPAEVPMTLVTGLQLTSEHTPLFVDGKLALHPLVTTRPANSLTSTLVGLTAARPAYLTVAAGPPPATGVTLDGPTAVTAGTPASWTITPDGSYTGTISVTYSGCGLDGTESWSYAASSAPSTLTLTPLAAGTLTITLATDPPLPANDLGPITGAGGGGGDTPGVLPADAVPVTGRITPTAADDTYPVIDPLYGVDGWRSVADAAARDSIPTPRRRAGMVAVTQDDLAAWQLQPGPWAGTAADWKALETGGGTPGPQGPAGHSPVLAWSGDQITIDGTVSGPHLTGPKGDTGSPGAAGATGPAGADGKDGHSPVLAWSDDQISIDGSVSGPHLTGPQGPKGDAGDVGPQGVAGTPGADGHSPVVAMTGDQITIDGAITGPHLTGPAGSGATPAGSSGQVQFNNGSGGLGASANLAWNGTGIVVGNPSIPADSIVRPGWFAGAEATGWGVAVTVENATNTDGSFASLVLRVGGTNYGMISAAKASLPNYGICKGLFLKPYTTGADVGIAAADPANSGTALGPVLLIKNDAHIGIGDNSGYTASSPPAQLMVQPIAGGLNAITARAAATGATANALEVQAAVGTPLAYLRLDGTIKPVALADASAPNDSIYYSTTAACLAYKNASGVVTPLKAPHDCYRFTASGTVATGQKPQTHTVAAAGVADQLTVTASAGTYTAQIDQSTDGGSTWTSLGSLALASGLSATVALSVAVAAGTLLRVNYTAASGVADPVVSLYVART